MSKIIYNYSIRRRPLYGLFKRLFNEVQYLKCCVVVYRLNFFPKFLHAYRWCNATVCYGDWNAKPNTFVFEVRF